MSRAKAWTCKTCAYQFWDATPEDAEAHYIERHTKPRPCGDPLGACIKVGPHDGPHMVAPNHPVLKRGAA